MKSFHFTLSTLVFLALATGLVTGSNFFNNTVFGLAVVNQTSNAKMFYQFIPATGYTIQNTTKPTILFMQGGPGCSSQLANLGEIGPYSVENDNGTLNLVPRNYSWSSEANLMFLDNPTNVGYSQPGSQIVIDSNTSAQQIQNLLEQFFHNYTNLAALDFWVMGESYGGHYVPAIAYQLLSNGSAALPKLTGIAMQNPWTDAFYQLESFGVAAYAMGIIDPQSRDRIQSLITEGREVILNGSYAQGFDYFDEIESYLQSFQVSGSVFLNNYRYYGVGQPSPKIGPVFGNAGQYLNQTDVKVNFGMPADFNYQLCDSPTYSNWAVDISKSYLGVLAYVLERTKVVIFNGADDMECNTAGVLGFVNQINWSGRPVYKKASKVAWQMKGNNVVGTARVGGNLTFLTVYGAGHFVPFDQPYSSLDMVQRLMAGNDNWNEPFNL